MVRIKGWFCDRVSTNLWASAFHSTSFQRFLQSRRRRRLCAQYDLSLNVSSRVLIECVIFCRVLQAASASHVESWRADRRHHRQKAIPRPQLHNTTRADHDLTYHASLAPKHFHTFRRHASSTARAEEGPSATLVGSAQANLNQYLEKRILVQLNGSRKVMGILRGYDVCFSIPHRL